MTDPTFVRTAYHYQPYEDFFRLAELSGFPICQLADINVEDKSQTYIITPVNGEWNHGWQNPQARIIWWDLEWRKKNEFPFIPGVSEVWASDVWYAGEVGAKYVPLGSHEDLPEYFQLKLRKRPFDVAAIMYRTNRRQAIIDRLVQEGVKVTPNGWGTDRFHFLNNSRLMLHLHQWPVAQNILTVAPLRFALAAAYHLPLITETCHDLGIFGYSHVMRSDYTHMVEFVKMWLKPENRNELADYGFGLHRLLCHDVTFRKSVENAL